MGCKISSVSSASTASIDVKITFNEIGERSMRVVIADHALKHGLTEDEIRHAWSNFIRMQHRPAPDEEYVVAIGCTRNGDTVQMVAVVVEEGYLVFHAMTPPTLKVLRELGLAR